MNKVILFGRLTKDIDLRYTQVSNTAVATFSLAVNRKFVKDGEDRQVDFFNIVVWSKLAETVSKYLSKGQQVIISGRLETRNWNDEQGQKKYTTEVIAEEIDFIERKKSQEESVLNETTTQDEDNEEYITSGDDLPF